MVETCRSRGDSSRQVPVILSPWRCGVVTVAAHVAGGRTEAGWRPGTRPGDPAGRCGAAFKLRRPLPRSGFVLTVSPPPSLRGLPLMWVSLQGRLSASRSGLCALQSPPRRTPQPAGSPALLPSRPAWAAWDHALTQELWRDSILKGTRQETLPCPTSQRTHSF